MTSGLLCARHEEREQKAALHAGWWSRLTHAAATHTSNNETPNSHEHEQLAQEPAEDVEAGHAGTVHTLESHESCSMTHVDVM